MIQIRLKKSVRKTEESLLKIIGNGKKRLPQSKKVKVQRKKKRSRNCKSPTTDSEFESDDEEDIQRELVPKRWVLGCVAIGKCNNENYISVLPPPTLI
jgi:hypothetical protein